MYDLKKVFNFFSGVLIVELFNKKLPLMRTIVLLAIIAFSFTGCNANTDNSDNQEVVTAVVGTWELYRDETLETVIDEWNGTEWTTVDTWFQNTRDNSRIILEFREDGTFVERYADVEFANGVWGFIDNGTYYFEYHLDTDNATAALEGRRTISMYCSNTYAIEIEGINSVIYYYRLIGTSECADVIDYNVE